MSAAASAASGRSRFPGESAASAIASDRFSAFATGEGKPAASASSSPGRAEAANRSNGPDAPAGTVREPSLAS
jgi:hypothetical protein